jgi:hypothetical protein
MLQREKWIVYKLVFYEIADETKAYERNDTG